MSSQSGKLEAENSSSGSLKPSGTRSKYNSTDRPPSSTGTTSYASASPSASSSANGYAARHAFKDSAGNDSTASKSPTGGSHAHSGRNMTASRRASVTERHVTERSYGHKRAASGDVGAACSVEALGLGSPASPAASTPHGRHSQAQSYSHRHGSAVAAAEHSTDQLSRTSSSSTTRPSPRLSRSTSNKPAQPTPAAAAGASSQQPGQQQQAGEQHEGHPLTEQQHQTAAATSAGTAATVLQQPGDAEAAAAAAALAAQVAAGVAAAVRSGTLSRNCSSRQAPSATDSSLNAAEQSAAASAATVKLPALPLLQTGDLASPATAGAAASPALTPPEANASPTKEHSSRLWSFGSPKKEKSNSKVSSEPSPAREKSGPGSRLWGHDSPLRRDKSSKRLSGSLAAGAPPVELSSSGGGTVGSPNETALQKQGSKNKLWSSEAAARAVASIFGTEGFNALRKSLSSSGRAAAAAAAAVEAANSSDGGLLQESSRAEQGATAAAVASILAGDADSSLLQLNRRSDAGFVDNSSKSSVAAEQTVGEQHQTQQQVEQGSALDDGAAAVHVPAQPSEAAAPAAEVAAVMAAASASTTPSAHKSPRHARKNSTLTPEASTDYKAAAHSPRTHPASHKSPRHRHNHSPRPAAAADSSPATPSPAAAPAATTLEDAAPTVAPQPVPVSLEAAIAAAVATMAAEVTAKQSPTDSSARVTPEVPEVASAKSPLVGISSDYRYSELLFRLQQFLPALQNAGTEPDDFEATWELLKSELTGLVSTARIASLQASRLEALDAEVMQLQRLLVEVGRSIKAGAQQQQLHHLVQSFPSFARRQINSEAGSTASTVSSSSSSRAPGSLMSIAASKFPAARPAAAAVVSSPSSSPHASTALQQQETVSAVAPSAAAASGLPPEAAVPASSGSLCTLEPQEQSQTPSRPAGIGRYAADTTPTTHVTIGRYTATIVSPESSYFAGSMSRSPAAASGKGSPGARSPGTGSGRSVVLPPPPKELTPDEAAQLVGLYRAVRHDPERISYKTLKVHSKQSSPATHPEKDSSPQHISSPPTAHNRSPTAAAANLGHKSSPRSDLSGQQHRDHPTARLSVDHSTGLVAEPSGLRPESSSSSSLWDYAHIGSSAGAAAATGVAKGFRVMESIPEAHKRANPGVVTGLAGTLRRDDTVGISPLRGSNVGGVSPNRRASSPDRTSSYYSPGDGQISPHRSSQGQRNSRMSSSSSTGSPMAVRSSGSIFKGARSPGSPGYRAAAAATDGSAGSPPTAAAAVGADVLTAALIPSISSPTIGVYGYDYVRARSASPNLGLHYLERSPIFKNRSPGSPGSPAAAAASSPRRSRAAGSISALPFSMSVSSVPTVARPTAAGALTTEKSQVTATGSSSVGVGGVRSPGAAVVPVLADDPSFRSACQAFREQQEVSPLHSSLSSSSTDPLAGSAKLVARLAASPTKDADSLQVDAAMNRLSSQMKIHGVSLEVVRLGPLLYSVGGRKLRLRMLNGNLLVRTGGGCMDLLVALGKLPVGVSNTSSASTVDTSASIGSHLFTCPVAGSDVATSLLDGVSAYGLGSSADSPAGQLSVAATGPGGSPSNNWARHISPSQSSKNLGLYTLGPLPNSSGGGNAADDTISAYPQVEGKTRVESSDGQGSKPEAGAAGKGVGGVGNIGDEAWMSIVAEAAAAAAGED